jgi:hypothetical protein
MALTGAERLDFKTSTIACFRLGAMDDRRGNEHWGAKVIAVSRDCIKALWGCASQHQILHGNRKAETY